MRIIVTGAAGFIGSHLCEALLARGDIVLGIDNVNDYYDQTLKRANIALITAAGAEFKQLDIREDIHSELEAFKPDMIVHLAAMAGVRYSIEQPLMYTDVNLNGTQNLLNTAKQLKVPFVFASSSSVYGARTDVPFKETDPVDNQISPYAATKRSGELLCNAHHHLTGLPVTCLRFFTVYGPRGRPDMAPMMFMQRILAGELIKQFGDGSSARDYTFVLDIVDGIMRAIDNVDGFEIFNLGNNTPVTLTEFITTIESVCEKKANITVTSMPPGDVPITFADISKAQKQLGYSPKTSLREGLEQQYTWLNKQ